MIDYIELQSHCKDTPNLSQCKPFPCRMNEYGWQTYFLQGCEQMQVHWRDDMHLLKVKGSLPYFTQGHNFSFSNAGYVEAINILQSLLDTGLWNASVATFEDGVIMPVEGKAKAYIKNHTKSPNSHLFENIRGKDRGAGKWWESPSIELKMYDAKANILMKQSLDKREIIQQYSFVPMQEYLKFEAHYKKPHLLNNGRDMIAENLQNPIWRQKLNEILINQYKQLKPMADLLKPVDKADFTALDIAVRELAKYMINEGKPLQAVKKQLYSVINQADFLTRGGQARKKDNIKKEPQQTTGSRKPMGYYSTIGKSPTSPKISQ